jgi:hypothetical protein
MMEVGVVAGRGGITAMIVMIGVRTVIEKIGVDTTIVTIGANQRNAGRVTRVCSPRLCP